MRLLLIGPPGGGKGTQGERLSAALGVPHIASGDVLRAEAAAGTPLGRRAARFMERGELVPDAVIIEALTPRLSGGFILDGFPRNLGQAEAVDKLVTFDAVIHLPVREPELMRRLLARAAVEGRADDTRTVIRHRLRVYAEQTAPLIEHYRRMGVLVERSGEGDVEAITASVLSAIRPLSTRS